MGFIFPNKSKVLEVTKINHDVVSLKIVKPFKFQHKVGQVVDLSIDKPGFELAVATFTIVNLPTDNHLEFIIKVYNNFNGLTKGISELVPNDIVQLSNAWDSFNYDGNGTFVAAGSGITSFLPIFKCLHKNGVDIKNQHQLIYSNKTKEDILLYNDLKKLFNNKLSLFLSRKKLKDFNFGRIDKAFLVKTIKYTEQKFYICGPREFEMDIKNHLMAIGINQNNIQTGYKF